MAAAPVVIVTGASRGYGKAVVEELFAIKQCNVLGTARSTEGLEQLKTRFGDHFDYVAGDIADASMAQKIVDKAMQKWGRIDAVVHNAGILEPLGRLADVDLNQWKTLIDVNVLSVVALTQKALPHVRASHGRMIFVSSGAATNAYHGWSAYCTSKAALNMVAKSVAAEEPDVVSIAIRPGVLDTDMQAQIRNNGQGKMEDESHKWFVEMHKSGKLVDPNKSGHVVAQLALHADKSMSGNFIDWEDQSLASMQKK
ncbi:hypothetical protein RI367_005776 [Sorochytrium milnesiophthora]